MPKKKLPEIEVMNSDMTSLTVKLKVPHMYVETERIQRDAENLVEFLINNSSRIFIETLTNKLRENS